MVDIVDKALRMGEGHQLKKLENVAKAVNALEDEISALSDEDLKAQTPKFKQEIENGKSLDEIMPERSPPCARSPSAPLASVTSTCSSWAVLPCTGATSPK